jgi:3-methylcrotonyl-CoA carboxylase alpha subunit
MFRSLLIANRGEIACRIIRTARRLGIRTVAVYSEADADARHVRLADQAVAIGPAAPRLSYLDGKRVLAAALASAAEAIHPGYGFLSENADFAEAVAAAGLVFIGPPPAAIRAMGSKSAAKALMETAGVPLVPGYHGDDADPGHLAREAARIGFPVLIKASAGGGGKGMRRVDRAEDFAEALAACRREAANAFGDDRVLIEKYLLRPRHIEIQVFADAAGRIVHLYERDCSVQRRHQKVLEEAPAPGMTPQRRAEMGAAAVRAAEAVGYVGAGTVEFIVDPEGRYYFMEMNTRLQVEHPVTEMITGQDLVEWQIRVAAGEPLPLAQDRIPLAGHAIEARIYAEDPDKGFLPATGRILRLDLPKESDRVRLDRAVDAGDTISPHYDPMIAKLIVAGLDRGEALDRLGQALSALHILGPANNVDFLGRLIRTPSFAAADLDTDLILREHDRLFDTALPIAEIAALAAVTELPDPVADARLPPWQRSDGWRLAGRAPRHLAYAIGGHSAVVAATARMSGWLLDLPGRPKVPARAEISRREGAADIVLRLGEDRVEATVIADRAARLVFLAGRTYRLERLPDLEPGAARPADGGALLAPMPGTVIALCVEAGARVAAGETLMILEAMKMEHRIAAPVAGVLRDFRCRVGEQVRAGADLVDFEPDAQEAGI